MADRRLAECGSEDLHLVWLNLGEKEGKSQLGDGDKLAGSGSGFLGLGKMLETVRRVPITLSAL